MRGFAAYIVFTYRNGIPNILTYSPCSNWGSAGYSIKGCCCFRSHNSYNIFVTGLALSRELLQYYRSLLLVCIFFASHVKSEHDAIQPIKKASIVELCMACASLVQQKENKQCGGCCGKTFRPWKRDTVLNQIGVVVLLMMNLFHHYYPPTTTISCHVLLTSYRCQHGERQVDRTTIITI